MIFNILMIEMLSQKNKMSVKLEIKNRGQEKIEHFTFDDFIIQGYQSNPKISISNQK